MFFTNKYNTFCHLLSANDHIVAEKTLRIPSQELVLNLCGQPFTFTKQGQASEETFQFIDGHYVLVVREFTDLHTQVLDRLYGMGITNIFIFVNLDLSFCTRGTHNPYAIAKQLKVSDWSVGRFPYDNTWTHGPTVVCHDSVISSMEHVFAVHEEYHGNETIYKSIFYDSDSYKLVLLNRSLMEFQRMIVYHQGSLKYDYFFNSPYLQFTSYHKNGAVELKATIAKTSTEFFFDIGGLAPLQEPIVCHHVPQMTGVEELDRVIKNDPDVNFPDTIMKGCLQQYDENSVLVKEISFINNQFVLSDQTVLDDIRIVADYMHFFVYNGHDIIFSA